MKSQSQSLALLVYAQVVASIVVAALCAVQVFATRQFGIQARTIQSFEARLSQNRQALGILISEAQQFRLRTTNAALGALIDSLRPGDPAAQQGAVSAPSPASQPRSR